MTTGTKKNYGILYRDLKPSIPSIIERSSQRGPDTIIKRSEEIITPWSEQEEEKKIIANNHRQENSSIATTLVDEKERSIEINVSSRVDRWKYHQGFSIN
jgi:Fe2+ transport system protein B